jgi:hypothetical protein
MKSKLENFLIHFVKLQRDTNNSPANLKWLVNKPAIADLCYLLNNSYIDISRTLIKKSNKHMVTPNVFAKRWDDYKNKWASIVAEAAKVGEELYVNELAKYLEEITDQAIADGKAETPEEFLSQELERWLEERGPKPLDLLIDNPANIMDDLYSLLQELIGNDYFDGLINNRHLEAWDFFEATIGIDYSKTYDRWQIAPELFIPSHMEGRFNITSIEDLYNEAVRAYVFGLTEASVAMCRALLEYILKKYYRLSGDNLRRIISEAENKYGKLKELKLSSKSELANKVLHDFENRGKEIEKAALGFLQTIRHLVINIPSP